MPKARGCYFFVSLSKGPKVSEPVCLILNLPKRPCNRIEWSTDPLCTCTWNLFPTRRTRSRSQLPLHSGKGFVLNPWSGLTLTIHVKDGKPNLFVKKTGADHLVDEHLQSNICQKGGIVSWRGTTAQLSGNYSTSNIHLTHTHIIPPSISLLAALLATRWRASR